MLVPRFTECILVHFCDNDKICWIDITINNRNSFLILGEVQGQGCYSLMNTEGLVCAPEKVCVAASSLAK